MNTAIDKLIEWMDLNYGHVGHSEVQAMAIQLALEEKSTSPRSDTQGVDAGELFDKNADCCMDKGWLELKSFDAMSREKFIELFNQHLIVK